MTTKRSLSLHFLQSDPVEALLIMNPETRDVLLNDAFREMFKTPDLKSFDDVLPYICSSDKDRGNLEGRISNRFDSPIAAPVKIKINDSKFQFHIYHEPNDDLIVLHAKSRAEFEQISSQLNEYAEGLVQNIFNLAVSERTLIQSKNRLAKQLRASSELGLTCNDHNNIEVVFNIFSETALAAMDVSRCGIWQMENNGKTLKASDIFISSDKSHLSDFLLHEDDYPQFFRYINKERILQAVDVTADVLTAGLYENYFKPAGIKAALIISVVLKGKVAGIVSFENTDNKTWEEDEIGFAVIFADHVARIMSDMEKDRLETQLRQAQKMETIGTLAGGLAHDFNNVLGGIVGTISIIEFKMKSGDEIPFHAMKEYIDTIKRSSHRAQEMVQQLLTVSRKSEATFVPVDLNMTIKHVMKICANTFDKSVELSQHPAQEDAVINADPMQIEQILLNLCVNGHHAMTIMRKENERPGGILTVSVRRIFADSLFCTTHHDAEEAVDYWILSIQDTGIGMDTKTIAKIFDPFFTTKDKGKGTGLGLAMVYNIIKSHKGFIDVYSEVGLGSTFSVYIPYMKCEMAVSAVNVEADIQKGQGTILVVDDEEVMRDLAREILKECGYDVLIAKDGQEAIDIFATEFKRIDLVLLDMNMPKKSGREAYISMKQINPGLKVILASGFREDERAKEILSLGVQNFLQKPYTIDQLAEAVSKTMAS